ncbi:uncharacterized protein LOC110118216 [Ceratitis capitata]|uniref:uncharacterized protein LOC110118216 n=1 Tax=Ceratitis capitata TaxID=7213 RepID=UPI000A11C311|nr:uncharacterized protein LOC110118216 [Ceratitis capitata]
MSTENSVTILLLPGKCQRTNDMAAKRHSGDNNRCSMTSSTTTAIEAQNGGLVDKQFFVQEYIRIPPRWMSTKERRDNGQKQKIKLNRSKRKTLWNQKKENTRIYCKFYIYDHTKAFHATPLCHRQPADIDNDVLFISSPQSKRRESEIKKKKTFPELYMHVPFP